MKYLVKISCQKIIEVEASSKEEAITLSKDFPVNENARREVIKEGDEFLKERGSEDGN